MSTHHNDGGSGGSSPRKKAKTEEAVRRGPVTALSAFEGLLHNVDVWRSTLSPLLDPIDLIRLMHVSRASRRVAAPILNALEAVDPQTAGHANMFRGFLRRPPRTSLNWILRQGTIPGPWRVEFIAGHAPDIEKRFAILRYQKTYEKEESLVALFDEDGAFVGQYIFRSEQFYEEYYHKDSDDIPSDPDFSLLSSTGNSAERVSGYLRAGNAASNSWKWRKPTKAHTADCAWDGNVLFSHLGLIDAFAGMLSPTEAMFVLMHALSSDTRGIYAMTTGFVRDLEYAFEEDEHELYNEEANRLLGEFKEKLLQISYPEYDEGCCSINFCAE